MEPFELVVTLLRVWLGLVMVAHGIHHARSIEGTARWFATKGFRKARLNALMSAGGELAIGAGLVLGLATAFAAAGLIATTTVAFWSIHRLAGFFVFERPDEGWEYVATLALTALAVAGLGPGPWSLDSLLGITVSGWPGLAIACAGVLVGAIQLAVFWRRAGDSPGKVEPDSRG